MLGYSSPDLAQLLAEFRTQTLSKAAWTHEAHLCVGLCYVKQYSMEDAICRLRAGIILLNDAHGTENTENSGYHETLTIFWAKVIFIYIEMHPDMSIEELPQHFLKTRLARRDFPFEFYERESLLSSAYRAAYRAPERKILNRHAIQHYLD